MMTFPHRGQLPRWRRLAIGVTAVLALAACGGGSSSSGSASSGATTKKITFWLSASKAQAQGYVDLAKDFEAKTGTAVEIVNIPSDGFKEKLKQAAQANSLPDVGSVSALDRLWMNQLQDITDIATSPTNNINKSVLTATKEGKYLSIPSDITAAGVFINKTLFDKAGVTYPTDPAKTWTWDEFLAALEKVRTKAGAKYDMVYDHSSARIRAYLYTNGAKGFQLDDNLKYYADATTVEAIKKFAALSNDVIMPKSVWAANGDPSALFKSGQVAAYVSGVWQVADFADSITNFEWASVPMPAQPVHATDINIGGSVVAFNNGDRAAAAKKFVAFLFDPANYTKVAQTNGYLPVETGLTLTYPFTSKAAQDAFALYNKEIALADPISTSGNRNGSKLLLSGAPLVVADPVKSEMAKLVNGQQDAQKTVDNIVAALNNR